MTSKSNPQSKPQEAKARWAFFSSHLYVHLPNQTNNKPNHKTPKSTWFIGSSPKHCQNINGTYRRGQITCNWLNVIKKLRSLKQVSLVRALFTWSTVLSEWWTFLWPYLSEALILAPTNPYYDNRLFIELWVQYIKIPCSEHVENMLRTCWEHVENMLTTCFVHELL